jgi:small multidrug resistance pump
MNDEFRIYRGWFCAAAIYNGVWGIAVVMFPGTLLRLAGLEASGASPLAQVVGMMVGVYAYGYYLLAREPKRYAGFIWIGLAGKTFGPLGFAYSVAAGTLPWRFGWVCLFNDLIWWPVFWRFALTHARDPLPALIAPRSAPRGARRRPGS